MKIKLNTAPSIEPITLLELKKHLRIDSTSFADDISSEQSIAPGAHVVAASYSLEGTGIDVSGCDAIVNLVSGTNGTSGTVDVKIQESDDDSTYTDWTGGAFTQITTSNDNATYEKAYTGTKQYIRVVATVAVDTCSFGVNVIKDAPTSSEDTYLEGIIKAVRLYFEEHLLNRALITQIWEYYLDKFPESDDFIEIPKPPLQSITSLIYTDSDGTANTFSSDDYSVDSVSEMGRLVLGYNKSWPTATLTPQNPIKITFTVGYGVATTDVPELIRQGILVYCADMYEVRQTVITGTMVNKLSFVEKMLQGYRVWSF